MKEDGGGWLEGKVRASTRGNARPMVWREWEERLMLGYKTHQVLFSATAAACRPFGIGCFRAGCSHAEAFIRGER